MVPEAQREWVDMMEGRIPRRGPRSAVASCKFLVMVAGVARATDSVGRKVVARDVFSCTWCWQSKGSLCSQTNDFAMDTIFWEVKVSVVKCAHAEGSIRSHGEGEAVLWRKSFHMPTRRVVCHGQQQCLCQDREESRR